MRLYAERAQRFLGSMSPAEFENDELIQDAVIRCVEVIGEAARLVSDETCRRAPDIPWSVIVGMRHFLAHNYSAVDLGKVHNVVTQHIPDLLLRLPPLIRLLEQDVGWNDDAPDEAE